MQAWLNGRVLPGERSPGAWRAAWRAAPGDPQRIELALDPGADPRGRLEGWIVELIPRPEPSRVCGGSSSE